MVFMKLLGVILGSLLMLGYQALRKKALITLVITHPSPKFLVRKFTSSFVDAYTVSLIHTFVIFIHCI